MFAVFCVLHISESFHATLAAAKPGAGKMDAAWSISKMVMVRQSGPQTGFLLFYMWAVCSCPLSKIWGLFICLFVLNCGKLSRVASQFVNVFVYPFKPQPRNPLPRPPRHSPFSPLRLFRPLGCQQTGSFTSLSGKERVHVRSRSRRCAAACFPSCRFATCKGGSGPLGRRLKSPLLERVVAIAPVVSWQSLPTFCSLLPCSSCMGKVPGAFPTGTTSLALKTV